RRGAAASPGRCAGRPRAARAPRRRGTQGWAPSGGTVPSPAVTVRTPPPPPAADPAALVELATDVALRAARLLLDGVGRARATVETKSSATDMVSEMDRAAEHLILDALLGARPDDGIVAEEGSSRPGTSGVRWVVDPLDGTTNYLYGLPGWAVSIAAEDDGGVVAGVVVDGVQGEVFSATRGGGARLDGEPITCSAKDDPATALVGTGFGYDPRRRAAQGAVVAELLPRGRGLRRPLLGRLRPARRLLRGRTGRLGPRGRWPDRRGGGRGRDRDRRRAGPPGLGLRGRARPGRSAPWSPVLARRTECAVNHR